MRVITEDTECGCYRPPSAKKLLACYRTSSLPTGADAKAAHAQLAKIQRDMIRTRRLLMVDGQRRLTEFLKGYFDARINNFCDRVMAHLHIAVEIAKTSGSWDRKDTAIDTITLEANSEVWRSALVAALGTTADAELIAAYTPIVQSIAARAYERTSTFIGEELAVDRSFTILRRAQSMAEEVTSINETTRARLVDTLEQALAEKQTVAEAVRTIRETIPEIEAGRIPTIARTEIGNAIDAGTKQALLESSTVKTVMVIGCQAREARSPQYNGQSTCNIRGVPVRDVDKLRFHPNHTGCIVPETFIGEG